MNDNIYPVAVEREAAGALTYTEVAAVEQLGALAGMLGAIVADGPTREADLRELIGHVHALQAYVLGQAAARVYPDLFRLLGESRR